MKRKKLSITMNNKDMDIVEDIFFSVVGDKAYEKIKPRLIRIWEELYEEMENANK